MRLLLLDADVTIDFLGLDVFDRLVKKHNICAASTVIGEIRFYWKLGKKIKINFRKQYVDSGMVREFSASAEEVEAILSKLPPLYRDAIHLGELESLAILVREEGLGFCTCDAATIRALPFVDASEQGISVERLLKVSGLTKSGLKDRHTEQYFKDNLAIGQRDRIYHFRRLSP